MNRQEFYMGKVFDAYDYFGAHPKGEGTWFRTFAPNAQDVSVIGEFNGWTDSYMERDGQSGFFQCFIRGAKKGMMYKYRIYHGGGCTEHCDPYGFGMELRPNAASIIRDLKDYHFHDRKWMSERTRGKNQPLNIYEVHLGSWKENPEDPENHWYHYDEIAKDLVSYVKEWGYNYIEFMPLSEHPADCSWGYQNTGFFSPTSRYGTAEELMKMVDYCHENEIGVIMDFVPVHFAVDAYGLACYDGTPLYEYPNDAVGESEWGSYNFMHSRGEVRSFLQSAADYWLEKYHFDGIRMDAISRIIYWQGDESRGVNGNAVDFVKVMNEGLHRRHRTAMLFAEDSTNFAGMTKPVEDGGLGFDYKWDLGWMNDTLDYFKKLPKERSENYHKLTFSMMYYYNENYLLPFSHDEVVHGKATIVQKMNGEYEDKFSQARALYMYMYMHPGKKLNFMGNELGQLREWDEKREPDWGIIQYPIHDAFRRFMKELNHLYLENDAFYEDYNRESFEWLDCHQEEKCIYSILRKGKKTTVAGIFNFSDKCQKGYEIEFDSKVVLEEIMNSDWDRFHGTSTYDRQKITAKKSEGKFKVSLDIPAYSAVYWEVR